MSSEQASSPGAGQFVHLHVHSEYSLLDGLGKVNHLVARAKELGMPALALTDHGSMYGVIEFYQAARAAGIKPIIGVETYVAKRTMYDREAEDKGSAHLLLLAKDYSGYKTLVKLVSEAQVNGFYYKPRIDHALLEKHHEGLVISSSCPSGEVARAILRDDLASARKAADFYRSLVGEDSYYLEIQDHGLPDQKKINQGVLQLSREMGIPVIATNDVHYVRHEHAEAQEILLCVQTNTTMDDPNRMRMDTQNFYLRSAEEMAQVFAEVPQALSNTLRVADQCNLEMDFNRVILPELDFIPEGMSPMEYLARLSRQGLEERYPNVTDEIRNRLEYELSVIEKTGFPKYILLVWDYVNWARQRGIFCQPRGSAAGSIVLYCLRVADVDPLEYDLTFERFLNPDRVQMPDIDMDFQDDRRDEVIEYVTKKYGTERVAQIVTFGRMAARAAIRDVGRAIAMPLSEVDRIAKLIPTLPVGMTIEKAMAENPDLKGIYDSDPQIKRLIDAAQSVEGVARHASTHAAGVVVSRDPLTEVVPIQPVQKSSKAENLMMAQYSMKPLEKVGLLKMDFLGLNNLTILANSLRWIARMRAVDLDLSTIPLDDDATFEMLGQGETTGIFQLEGMGMRRWVRELKPSTVRHLMAIVALYRPGPMSYIPTYIARKEGREPIKYIHPKLEPILKETYGVIVYQDQVIKSVVAVAGFSMGQADILRNAMSKKIRDVMAKQKDLFIEGAQKNGITEAGAQEIWEQIEPFAGYAFNKAHAACYAMLAYQTAYLKTHYPVEYMAALCTSYVADTDKIVLTLGECRRLGVQVLPPDINRSELHFSVEPLQASSTPLKLTNSSRNQLAVRFGLIGVKNVGEGAIISMVEEREKNGDFKSLSDFCRRIDTRTINKRVLESLIKCGAMDAFGDRGQLLRSLDQCLDAAQQEQRAQLIGQFTMFDSMFDAPVTADPATSPASDPALSGPVTGEKEKLAWEKEVLGFYISSHPFQRASLFLEDRVNADSSMLVEESDGKVVTMAGVVAGVKPLTTKKGDRMLAVQMEDLHGGFEVVVFPKTYNRTKDVWAEDAVIIVEGKVDAKDEQRKKLLCEKAERFTVPEGEPPPVRTPRLLAPATVDGAGPEALDSIPGEIEDPGEEPEFQYPEELPVEFLSTPLGEERVPVLVGAAVASSSQAAPQPQSYSSAPTTNGAENGRKAQANGNGNGNGGANGAGNGNGRKGGNGRKPLHVVITLHRRGSDEADLAILREVYQALSEWHGQDSYELCVVNSHGRTYLRGSEAMTSFNTQLEASLKEILGPDCLTISESGAA